MTSRQFQKQFDALQEQEDWPALQRLLEREIEADQENHWLLTQLGSAIYEQKQYTKALSYLERSLVILDDCPLTLWHKAGTLDALKRHTDASRIYQWIINTTVTAKDDPCWESEEWSLNLKADALYRLGQCKQKLGLFGVAEGVYRRCYDLLLAGVHGTYNVDDITEALRSLHEKDTSKKRVDRIAAILNSVVLKNGGVVRKRNTALVS